MNTEQRPDQEDSPLGSDEQAVVEARKSLRSTVVYEVVRQEGENELARPLESLWWSGIAAGVGAFTAIIAEGLLRHHLPDNAWRPLIENFGYCVGFLIAVLGRMQLFTENTITAVLPLFAHWSGTTLASVARLWSVVLAANVTGAAFTAAMVLWGGLVAPQFIPDLISVAREFAHHTPVEAFSYGIPAGFLIATIVWLLPNAHESSFGVIVVFTYLIGIGGFTHVVVGTGEMALLMLAGELSFFVALPLFLATLTGNILGGTGLFALLAYAQVRRDV